MTPKPVACIFVIDAHQQQRLVAVIVKTESRARWPAVSHLPKAGDAVASVEYVGHIDKEELSFLLVLLLGKEGSCHVHRALYPRF